MRSTGVRRALLQHGWCPQKKGRERHREETHTSKGDRRRQRQRLRWGNGCKPRKAKGYWQPPKLGRGKDSPLQISEGAQTCRHLDLRLLASCLRCLRQISVVLTYPVRMIKNLKFKAPKWKPTLEGVLIASWRLQTVSSFKTHSPELSQVPLCPLSSPLSPAFLSHTTCVSSGTTLKPV